MAGMEARHQGFCPTSATACHPTSPTWPPPSPRTGRSPPDPPRLVGRVHLQRHHPLRPGRLRIGGRRGGGLFAHAEACGFGHWGPPPHPDQRLDQSPAAHPVQRPLRMLRRRLLLGKPCINGPWRWTTSCPGTMAEPVHRRCLSSDTWAQPGIPRRHGADGLALHQPEWNAVVDAGRRSRNQIRWAGTVRWSAARPQEPVWPASNHGWPASSARSLR